MLDWDALAGKRPRDFRGYGDNPPLFQWRDNARVAINFAINFEEGTERSPLLGDGARDSRTWVKSQLPETERDLMQEGEYEYGTRSGIWRLLRIFAQYDAPFSVFASSEAFAVNPQIALALSTADCDVISHGSRSIAKVEKTEESERADIRHSVQQTLDLTGKHILGAFLRPPVSELTRDILAEEGFLYDSATSNDDIPYYATVQNRPMLVVPYAVDTNDARFWGGQSGPGYTGSADFFDYLKSAFDVLYAESEHTARMMSIGLHARIMRPGRVAALIRFLDYVKQFDDIWIAQRNDIAFDFLRHVPQDNVWNYQ